jgi:MFS family permease
MNAGETEIPVLRRWWALAVITAIYTIHAVDRTVVSIVLEPLKNQFHLSDRAAGFLGGLAHSAGFVVTVIPLGMLVDRVNRVRLLGGMVILWSGLTLFASWASSFIGLALCRLGVGAAEGGGSSCSLSLIADYFPKHQRGAAFGIFFSSTALGVGLIFLFGGMIVGAYGWRAAFAVAGLPGVLLGLLALLTLRNPQRGRYDEGVRPPAKAKAPPLSTVLRHIATTPTLGLSILGLTLATAVVAGLWAWAASFFERVYGLSLRDTGLVLAIALGLVQGAGLPLFGRLSDRLTRDRPDRIHVVAVFGMLASIPIGAIMLLTPSLELAIVGVMLLGASTAAWLGQTFGAVAALAPPAMRGSVVGFGQLCTNLIGTGCGPLLVGALSDAFGGQGALRYGMMAILAIYLAAAASLMRAMRLLRRDRAVNGGSAAAGVPVPAAKGATG